MKKPILVASAAMIALGWMFVLGAAYTENKEGVTPVVELCEGYATDYLAALTCKDDWNCVLTLEDYTRLVGVDKFIKRYCKDERQTSKKPPPVTANKETYTL